MRPVAFHPGFKFQLEAEQVDDAAVEPRRTGEVPLVADKPERVAVQVTQVGRAGKIRLARRELPPLPEGEEGERARERMASSREAGPPRDRGPRRDGPPRGGGRGGPRGR